LRAVGIFWQHTISECRPGGTDGGSLEEILALKTTFLVLLGQGLALAAQSKDLQDTSLQ
jgi:hypothetical protein